MIKQSFHQLILQLVSLSSGQTPKSIRYYKLIIDRFQQWNTAMQWNEHCLEIIPSRKGLQFNAAASKCYKTILQTGTSPILGKRNLCPKDIQNKLQVLSGKYVFMQVLPIVSQLICFSIGFLPTCSSNCCEK